MPTWVKYLLLQVPGWLFSALILVALIQLAWISQPAALAIFFLLVLKDLILYPWLRKAYEARTETGVEALVGARGVAQEELKPNGFVRVRGELWRAEVEPKDEPVSVGSRVRVVAAEGMTLIVKAERDPR